MLRNVGYLAILIACSVAAPTFAQEVDRVEMIEDRANAVTQLRIGIRDGEVAMADVFRAVARVNGYDDTELRNVLPEGRVQLQDGAARWSLDIFNKVMRPCVQVHANKDSFDITIDRESSQRWINDCKSNVRWAWSQVDWRNEKPEYGLKIVGDVLVADDIVVLVHGLNSRPEDLVALIPVVDKAGLVSATFRFPNDQPIVNSAKLLSDELLRLKREYPERKIRLLTHSMGGLVARAAIETDLDPGNVSQLIMVAPPNQGSSLAQVATFMDCYEFFTSSDHRRAGVLIESVSDGLGEATADLAPRSVFLDRLNSLDRNPQVGYTILLGTGGPMNEDEMKSLREAMRDYTDGNRFLRFASSKLNAALENLDEVVCGKGDGAVSHERGKLRGVQDIVTLPFSHANVLNPNQPTTQKAYDVILSRLISG